MIKDDKLNKNIEALAAKYNTTKGEVEKVVNMSYDLIRSKITELNIADMDLEELRKAKTNFYMPGLFKLFVSEPYFKYLNKIEDEEF